MLILRKNFKLGLLLVVLSLLIAPFWFALLLCFSGYMIYYHDTERETTKQKVLDFLNKVL